MKYLFSLWKSLSLLVVLQIGFAAADYCGYYRGQSWYCDGGRYCCGTNGVSYLCCASYISPFYSWWYFWVGIVGFFFILSAAIACCRRSRARRQMAANRNVQVTTTTMQVGQNPPPTFNNGGAQYGVSNPAANLPPYATTPQPYPGVQQQYAAPPAYDPAAYNNFDTTKSPIPPQ